MNQSGGAGTLTVPKDLASKFDLDVDGVDVVYLEDDSGDVILKPADMVEL
jgi:bifunctional DNA-binding transcriptional regulator/antitoxin component of YhaV-PrlF toxin-antitoxin module